MSEKAQNAVDILIAILLVAATLTVFWQVRTFDFVNLDDNVYVERNPVVAKGLTDETLRWAFSGAPFHFDGLWMPLTWLSFLMDASNYGIEPGGFHMTNLWFHALNTLLLFWVLKSMTGARWASAFVAALFALHPLHVESVAWVAERKDVLSTFFWLLALQAYAAYARRPRWALYAAMVLLYACSLMAKPMAVTFPFLLLVLDYWPLQRFQKAVPLKGAEDGGRTKSMKEKVFDLASEKILLLAMALVVSKVTFFAQQQRGSIRTMVVSSLPERVANTAMSYLHYIRQMFWPHPLAVHSFVENPGDLLWKGALAAAVLLIVTAAVLRRARRFPYLAAGWLFYVITLAPVSGIAQTGVQLTADRFTYVPLIGLFIALAWGAADALRSWKYGPHAAAATAAVVLPALMLLSARQTATWRNSLALYEHALAIDERNHTAQINYAQALLERDDGDFFDQATNHLARALELKPDFLMPHGNWGRALLHRGRYAEAVPHLERYARRQPDMPEIHLDLALALYESGDKEQAMRRYEMVAQEHPDSPILHNEWGVALAKEKRYEEAITHLEKAIELNPGMVLACLNLGKTLQAMGQSIRAIDYFRRAVQLESENPAALNLYAYALATHPNPMIRNGHQALQMAKFAAALTDHQDPVILHTLAASYAEVGRFDEAAAAAEKALALAKPPQQDDLIESLGVALAGYREDRPLRMKEIVDAF